MKRTFKYRIYASPQTLSKAENWLELLRELYNSALAERIYAWKMQHKSLHYFDQQNELPDVKKAIPELKQVGAHVLQNALKRLDESYKKFFNQNKKYGKVGYPRFKGKNRYDSFTFPDKENWELDSRYLWITNIGRFKMKLSRPIQGKIKTVSIKRTPTNKWYVYFSCDNVPENKLEPSTKVVGLDMGIKSYLTDSEGNKVENHKFLKHSLNILKIGNRKLARTKNNSKRHKKIRLTLSKSYEKIANQRYDFLHKLSNQYIKNYGTIVIEDLPIPNMVKNHKLARDINDCSWGIFFDLLEYKAEEAGRTIIRNDKFAPTSKACSNCGEINHNLKLSDREWVCLKCGSIHDRDINAAKNILSMGLGETFKR